MIFPHLTIAFITCRRDCKWEWFLDSLLRQHDPVHGPLHLIAVDFYATERVLIKPAKKYATVKHTMVKSTVWQGPNRLPAANWWAISNARNTALCLAPDGWIAFVDDRSVLMPGWLACVREAQAASYGVFGAYEKAFDLNVGSDGLVHGFTPNPAGQDHRLAVITDHSKAASCSGAWCFGCGGAYPLEWALAVNGYDEAADGLSFEDVIFGLMLEKQGCDLRFDPRMKVLQDRTPALLEPPFRRTDKGTSPNDKSHALLNMVLQGGRHSAPNYFPEGGLRALRQHVLAGEAFPTAQIPCHDWFDGAEIKDMV